MPSSPAYSTIVFDFDGTIADTLEAAIAVYNELALEVGSKQITPEEVPALRHLSLKAFINYVGVSTLSVPRLLFKGRSKIKANIGNLPLIEGMHEALVELKQEVGKLGILTSNSTENVELFLKAHGISHLFDFISSSSKLTGKAKNLRAICKTFSNKPANMIYVGDETRDIQAAHRAGVASCGVGWGFNSKEALEQESPTLLCNSTTEIVSALLGR